MMKINICLWLWSSIQKNSYWSSHHQIQSIRSFDLSVSLATIEPRL